MRLLSSHISNRSIRRATSLSLLLAFMVSSNSCLAPATNPAPIAAAAAPAEISQTASIDADLYFKFETAWEDDAGNKTLRSLCKIDRGDPTVSKSCTVSIPEAELFFGKVFMTYGTADRNICKVIVFRPFYYLGNSSSLAFLPPWEFNPSDTDCTARPIPAACFQGAAKTMVPDFPAHSGIYFLTSTGVESSANAESASLTGQARDNTWIANNLVDRTTAIPGRYVGSGVYQDWKVECLDSYYEPVHEITLTISDQDIEAGEDPGDPDNDDFYDWEGN